MKHNATTQGPKLGVCDSEKPRTKSKEKSSQPKHAQRCRKQTMTSYSNTEDGTDKDVILRMVLPGYNWFEEQVKNNMYTADGEKRIIATKVCPNPRLKINEGSQMESDSVLSEDTVNDFTTKQKSLLSKGVINSTLMLLPNNSLPLKKRKIKENNDENLIESKKISIEPIQENKKSVNPPIQKVIPIFNNNSSNQETSEIKAHHQSDSMKPRRFSAFKTDLMQRRFCEPNQRGYGSYPTTLKDHAPLNSLDSGQLYPQIMRRNSPYCLNQDVRLKYQTPCHLDSGCCYQSNMYRHQTTQIGTVPSQEYVKPSSNYPPTQNIVPPPNRTIGYLPSNSYRSYGSYDSSALLDIKHTFPKSDDSLKAFSNYFQPGPMYPSNLVTPQHYNMTSSPLFYPDGYWCKPPSSQLKPVLLDAMCNEYPSTNLLESLNIVPMMNSGQFSQQYPRGYHHIG